MQNFTYSIKSGSIASNTVSQNKIGCDDIQTDLIKARNHKENKWFDAAAKIYRDLIEKNVHEAMYAYAEMLKLGWAVDDSLAIVYLQKAAELGNEDAIADLAKNYLNEPNIIDGGPENNPNCQIGEAAKNYPQASEKDLFRKIKLKEEATIRLQHKFSNDPVLQKWIQARIDDGKLTYEKLIVIEEREYIQKCFGNLDVRNFLELEQNRQCINRIADLSEHAALALTNPWVSAQLAEGTLSLQQLEKVTVWVANALIHPQIQSFLKRQQSLRSSIALLVGLSQQALEALENAWVRDQIINKKLTLKHLVSINQGVSNAICNPKIQDFLTQNANLLKIDEFIVFSCQAATALEDDWVRGLLIGKTFNVKELAAISLSGSKALCNQQIQKFLHLLEQNIQEQYIRVVISFSKSAANALDNEWVIQQITGKRLGLDELAEVSFEVSQALCDSTIQGLLEQEEQGSFIDLVGDLLSNPQKVCDFRKKINHGPWIEKALTNNWINTQLINKGLLTFEQIANGTWDGISSLCNPEIQRLLKQLGVEESLALVGLSFQAAKALEDEWVRKQISAKNLNFQQIAKVTEGGSNALCDPTIQYFLIKGNNKQYIPLVCNFSGETELLKNALAKDLLLDKTLSFFQRFPLLIQDSFFLRVLDKNVILITNELASSKQTYLKNVRCNKFDKDDLIIFKHCFGLETDGISGELHFLSILNRLYSKNLYKLLECIFANVDNKMTTLEQIGNANIVVKNNKKTINTTKFTLTESMGMVSVIANKTNQKLLLKGTIEEIIFNAASYTRHLPRINPLFDTNIRRENIETFARTAKQALCNENSFICRLLTQKNKSNSGMKVYRGDTRGPFELFVSYGGLGTKVPELDLHQVTVYGFNNDNVKQNSPLEIPKNYVCTSTDKEHANGFTGQGYLYEIDTSILSGAVIQELAKDKEYKNFRKNLVDPTGLIKQADNENEVLILHGIPLGYGCIKQVWSMENGSLEKMDYDDTFMVSTYGIGKPSIPNCPDYEISEFIALLCHAKYEFIALPRPRENNPIIVPYAKFAGNVVLNNCSLMTLFSVAGDITINIPYQGEMSKGTDDSKRITSDGIVYRQNHNVTHSVRQVKIFEAILAGIKQYGNVDAKKIIKNLSKDETFSLKMAVFFKRAGRVDESGNGFTNPDEYKKRSAQIFKLYAQQTNLPKDLIEWAIKLIEDSCIPSELRKHNLIDKKSLMMLDLLSETHNLDLYRCRFPEQMIETENNFDISMHKYMNENSGVFLKKIKTYAQNLIIATGATADGKWSYKSKLYVDCSNDVIFCFDCVDKISL